MHDWLFHSSNWQRRKWLLCGIWVIRVHLKLWKGHLWLLRCSFDLTLRSSFASMWIGHRRASVPFYLKEKARRKELWHTPAKDWHLHKKISIPWRENVMHWYGASCTFGSICIAPTSFLRRITSHWSGWQWCLMHTGEEDIGSTCSRISVSRFSIDRAWNIPMWMRWARIP